MPDLIETYTVLKQQIRGISVIDSAYAWIPYLEPMRCSFVGFKPSVPIKMLTEQES